MSKSPVKNFIPTAKQKQAADPAHSVWVSANAGSGKTQVLVQRVIRLLLEGTEPASILCITYTKAAAAEMTDRLFSQLASWTGLSDSELATIISNLGADGKSQAILTRARKLFTLALETPGGLKIQTIHAFCERLLHLFPVEAGLAPGFGLLDERAADELREKSITDVVYGPSTTPEVAEVFERLSTRLNMEAFGELMKSYISGLRKASPEIQAMSPDAISLLLKQSAGLPLARSHAEAEAEFCKIDRGAYARHAAALMNYKSYYEVHAGTLLAAVAKAADPMDALLALHFTEKGEPRKRALLSTATVKDQPAANEFLISEAARYQELFQQLKSLELIEANADAYTVAAAALRRIGQTKQRSAKLDFEDLISRTAQLLSTSAARDWVSFKLDPGLSHILLDESQDTSPAQWLIINRLVEEFFAGQGANQSIAQRTLFVVGDNKQSIFRFQGADPEAYQSAKQKYLGAAANITDVPLDISYRSTDQILDAVDRVHTGIDTNGKSIRSHTAERKDRGLVEIWPMLNPEDEPDSDPWAKPVDVPPQSSPHRRLANTIAYQIKQWLDPANPRQLAQRGRAVNAGDILILFRRRNALFRMVMAELRAAGIPVAGADRLNLLGSLIVQDLLALLNWLLLPQDDHALACVLKSPLVPEPLEEQKLFDLAYDRSETLAQRLTGANRNWLTELQGVAAREPVDILLTRILTRSRKDIASRLGAEALEASDAMLDMAIDFQQQGAASLFAFVRWFMATETVLKREMDKAAGEVRLMTVHGAKGLEAAIVIIANAAQGIAGIGNRPLVLPLKLNSEHSLPIWFPSGLKPLLPSLDALQDEADKKEAEESDRLLYVAMTRAEDELYIAAVGNKRGQIAKDSWWPKITAGLGEPKGDEALRFGDADTYLPPALGAIGATKPMAPDWLTLLPRAEFEQPPTGLNAALSGTKTYDPAAAKQGRARHRLLQDLGDVAAGQRYALAKARAKRLGLAESEALALADALALPALQPFLGPSSRAEVDIRGVLPNGQKVNGRLDRLAERREGIWLLDYKTGTSASREHLIQMAGYVALLEQAFPARPITAALFFTANRSLKILSLAELTAVLQESDATSP